MTQAQKIAKAKFKQAIAYRTKTGVSLKEAFAHIYGKKKVVKKVVKKAAPKKVAKKKVLVKKPTKYKSKLTNKWKTLKPTDNVSELKKYGYQIKGVKDSALVKKELAKKGLKMPHGYTTVKRKRKISGVKKKPTETQVLKSIQKAVKTQKSHMGGSIGKVSSQSLQAVKSALSRLNEYKTNLDRVNYSIANSKKLGFQKNYISNLKDTKKRYMDLVKETKTHISQLKKHI